MTYNSNKDKQRQRMMSYFIGAARQIMQVEGTGSLSIRKVADRAGYNSATLYHYFSNLEELTLFASIGYLTDYAMELPSWLEKGEGALDKYLMVWKCFCRHSFCHPDVYRLLFFGPLSSEDLNDVFRRYYRIFPEEISSEIKDYESMLTAGDLYKREYIALTKALKKEKHTIPEDQIKCINEMNILIYRGMLAKIEESPGTMTVDQAVDKTIYYMEHTLSSYI